MDRFPTAWHLASCEVRLGVKEPAVKKGKGPTGHGNRYLAWGLGEAVVGWPAPAASSASVTDGSPAAPLRIAQLPMRPDLCHAG